jgi:immune inhibitor A
VFDDRNGSYWTADKPDAGVKVPDTNTQIVLDSQADGGKFMNVIVRPAS